MARYLPSWRGPATRHGAVTATVAPGHPPPEASTVPPAPRRAVRGLLILLAYLAAGVVVTWPRARYLSGRLPNGLDESSYVWGFWWIAHQAAHLSDPWFTGQLGAPAGVPLGFDTLMPLPGLLMTPVTLAFGPSASYNLLAVVTPGLLCYAAYRTARLWLSSEAGAIAAGAFYGLSTMLAWRDWYHLNLALGALFLPLTLSATVRLRRRPGSWRAAGLGAVVGAAFLVNQESGIMAAGIAGVELLHWLACAPRGKAAAVGLAALVAGLVASPQVIVMLQQSAAGAVAAWPPGLARSAASYGAPLLSLFAPSPRLADFGMAGLGSLYSYQRPDEGVVTFGAAVSVLAVIGAVAGWRRHGRWLAAVWLGCAALALGPALIMAGHRYLPLAQDWHGARFSDLMPYTWLVRVPRLAGFREPDRFALAGLLPAALLAGRGVEWLREPRRLAFATPLAWSLLAGAVAFGALEAGYSGDPGRGTMPASLPALDAPIMADHSRSVVVDIPFGIRGGLSPYGRLISDRALVMATADGHPRAVSYTSWTPTATIAALARHAFYRGLADAQQGRLPGPASVAAGRQDAIRMDVGWAVVWQTSPTVLGYLRQVGFRYRYRAGGVPVYRFQPH